MQEKRKKDVSGGKNSKKVRKNDDDKDFTTYMMSNYNADVLDSNINKGSSDDSDDDIGTFPAFDLPNFEVFGEEEPKPTEEEPSGRSNEASASGVIFLSDPSQLPTPISFSTPKMMNPVVIGAGKAVHNQVMVVNKPVMPGSTKMISHVQPVVHVLSTTSTGHSTTSTVTRPHNKPTTNIKITPTSGGNHIKVQTASSNKPALNAMPGKPLISTSTGRVSNATPAMSATTIMQQVMAAAQQAAKNIRAQGIQSTRHLTPNVPRNVAPVIRAGIPRNPFSQNTVRPVQHGADTRSVRPQRAPGTTRGSPLVNGNLRPGVHRPVNIAVSPPSTNDSNSVKKWKPYSDILNRLSRKLTRESARKLGINASSPLNLKQMYSLLRSKFSTSQIFDMCLWDMEHPDASLLEIAITNAFS